VTVADQLDDVRRRIEAAGGDPARITVVAVTKGFPPSTCHDALAAGAVDLGENYAQELVAKAADVASTAPASGVRWHFLGAVQRNKVARLAPHVHLWQAVDRADAGASIARHAPGARVLVQVNITGRPGRPGCRWDETGPLVEQLGSLGLDVQGLMGVGEQDEPRPGFRRLAAEAARLGLGVVSMGMSGDLEVAVQEGSTMVRIGTALFGPRPQRSDLQR
jgi:pyridoxal phosphate enzyme (YggS family)